MALVFTLAAFHGFGPLILLGPGLLALALKRVPPGKSLLFSALWGSLFAAVFYSWSLSYGWLPWLGLIVARGLPWIAFGLPEIALSKWKVTVPLLKEALATGLGLALVSWLLIAGPTGNDWETPIAALAEWPWCLACLPFLGLAGSGFLIGFISRSLLSGSKSGIVTGLSVLVLSAGTSAFLFLTRTPDTILPKLSVALVQTSWEQDKKWDESSREQAKEQLFQLTTEAAAESTALSETQLVIWPETAWPHQGMRKRPSDTRSIGRLARRLKIELLASSIESAPSGEWINSVSQVMPTGRFANEYQKHRLAPFAEYLPLPQEWARSIRQFRPFDQIGKFVAGDQDVVLEHNGLRYAVLVCFESMVPQPSAELAPEVDFFVVVTNDAPLIQQAPKRAHFRSAILRAAQSQKTIVQVANNGVSGIIDSHGVILRRTDPGFEGVVLWLASRSAP